MLYVRYYKFELVIANLEGGIMSKKVFQEVRDIGFKSIEMQLALQCAPLLGGLKVSNLFIVNNENAGYVLKIFFKTNISCFVLNVTDKKTIFFLYKADELIEHMNTDEVKKLLNILGYYDKDFKQFLIILKKRYKNYMKDAVYFPHEMGLLLGYPPEDVYGFIINNGKNFLYAGYWKVYKNLSDKINLFKKFSEAKENAVQLVLNGVGILEIIDIYSKDNIKKSSLGG
jgi:hypothetical protein